MPELEKKEEKLSLEEENQANAEKDWKSLLEQVNSEYEMAWKFMKPKIDEWALRLKLYNNQKRDKKAVGDPLMFTIHQTVLASLYSDRLDVEFEGTEDGDDEQAENINDLARYDEEKMQKDEIDYEWDWDASFFGRGLVLLNEFDAESKTPLPENIDIMTWLRDPDAKSVNGDSRRRGAMRYGGREIRLTKQEMKDARIYFNLDKLETGAKNDHKSLVDQNSRLRSEAQGRGDIQDTSIKGENKTYRIREWFTHWKGNKIIVGSANDGKIVVRYTVIGESNENWPIEDRAIYPMSKDWDGVSIPDLSEDKQRARSIAQNLGLAQIESNLHPRYVFDSTRINNKADLQNIKQNQFIPVDGSPAGAVVPLQTHAVRTEVQWILDILDVASQRATATPEIQQGVQSEEQRTASEINLVASKVDTRYSLSAKIFGWSEKKFWKQWYRIYKKHFKKDVYEKSIRISGAAGSKWRKLTRDNFIMAEDPDVRIESKILSESKRLQRLQMFRAFLKDAMATIGRELNMRFAIKHLAKLSAIEKDVIDRVIPPSVDELDAEEENEELSGNSIVEVEPTDDDIVHIDVHNKASDTKAKESHIAAHRNNMLLKKQRPELFPQEEATEMPELEESLQGIGGTLRPVNQPRPQEV